jgi:hypothetical protein
MNTQSFNIERYTHQVQPYPSVQYTVYGNLTRGEFSIKWNILNERMGMEENNATFVWQERIF